MSSVNEKRKNPPEKSKPLYILIAQCIFIPVRRISFKRMLGISAGLLLLALALALRNPSHHNFFYTLAMEIFSAFCSAAPPLAMAYLWFLPEKKRKEELLNASASRLIPLITTLVLSAVMGNIIFHIINAKIKGLNLAEIQYTNEAVKTTSLALPVILIVLFLEHLFISRNITEPDLKQDSVKKFAFRDKNGHHVLAFHEINYIQANNNICLLQTDSKTYSINKNLKTLCNKLPESDFIRIHKSYLANKDKIKSLEYDIGGAYIAYINDSDDSALPVGRNYAANVKKQMGLLKS